MISTVKALEFVRDVLEIVEFQELYTCNKLLALEKVMRAITHKIPFNNIEEISKPFCDRTSPTITQNIGYVLKKEGGLCWTFGTAGYYILSALGFDVILGGASVAIEGDLDHSILFVKGCDTLQSIHLVDIGASFPTFKPLAMDFRTDSDVYKTGAMWYKYVKRGDGKYIRFQHTRGAHCYDFATNEYWKPVYYFDFPYSIDFETLGRSIKKQVYDDANSLFNLGPRLCRYVNEKLIAVKHDTILIENDDGLVVKKHLTDDVTLVNEILNYFPEINRDKIFKAISIWRQRGSPTHFSSNIDLSRNS